MYNILLDANQYELRTPTVHLNQLKMLLIFFVTPYCGFSVSSTTKLRAFQELRCLTENQQITALRFRWNPSFLRWNRSIRDFITDQLVGTYILTPLLQICYSLIYRETSNLSRPFWTFSGLRKVECILESSASEHGVYIMYNNKLGPEKWGTS